MILSIFLIFSSTRFSFLARDFLSFFFFAIFSSFFLIFISFFFFFLSFFFWALSSLKVIIINYNNYLQVLVIYFQRYGGPDSLISNTTYKWELHLKTHFLLVRRIRRAIIRTITVGTAIGTTIVGAGALLLFLLFLALLHQHRLLRNSFFKKRDYRCRRYNCGWS